MANLSIKDIFVLANRRKNFNERRIFILQAMIFFPFLKSEERALQRKNGSEGSLSSSGDDVYPLF
jgi:hypothetical protein